MTQSPFARANGPGRLVINLQMGSEEWCRGTELNCRHQPFQCINKASKTKTYNKKTMQKVTFYVMENQ